MIFPSDNSIAKTGVPHFLALFIDTLTIFRSSTEVSNCSMMFAILATTSSDIFPNLASQIAFKYRLITSF